jgi:hypothetical protein
MSNPEQKAYDEITAEDFQCWTENPVTRLVVQRLAEKREHIANFMLGGGCSEVDGDTQRSYSFHAGQVRGLNELFFLFEEVKEDAAEEARKEQMNYDH